VWLSESQEELATELATTGGGQKWQPNVQAAAVVQHDDSNSEDTVDKVKKTVEVDIEHEYT
jgi:hypothetical protein